MIKYDFLDLGRLICNRKHILAKSLTGSLSTLGTVAAVIYYNALTNLWPSNQKSIYIYHIVYDSGQTEIIVYKPRIAGDIMLI